MSERAPATIGDVVAERYLLQKDLAGQRSHAVAVWGAFDTELEVHCVIKVPASAAAFARELGFLTEHKSLAFPKVFDPIELGDRRALVLEHRRGVSLRRFFERTAADFAVDDGDVLRALGAAAEALAAIHATGHRYGRIGPDDLLLEDDRATLLGFGGVRPVEGPLATAADLRLLAATIDELCADAAVAGAAIHLHPPTRELLAELRCTGAAGGMVDAKDLAARVALTRSVLAALEAPWPCHCGRTHGEHEPWRCPACGEERRDAALEPWRRAVVGRAAELAREGDWNEALERLEDLGPSAVSTDAGCALYLEALLRAGRDGDAAKLGGQAEPGPRADRLAAAWLRVLAEVRGPGEARAHLDAAFDAARLAEREGALVRAAANVYALAGDRAAATALLGLRIARAGGASGAARTWLARLEPPGSAARLAGVEEAIGFEGAPVEAFLEVAALRAKVRRIEAAFAALAEGRRRFPRDGRLRVTFARLAERARAREGEAAEAALRYLARVRDGEDADAPRVLRDLAAAATRLLARLERWALIRELAALHPDVADDPSVASALVQAELVSGSAADAAALAERLWDPRGAAVPGFDLVCVHAVRAALEQKDRGLAERWRDRLASLDAPAELLRIADGLLSRG